MRFFKEINVFKVFFQSFAAFFVELNKHELKHRFQRHDFVAEFFKIFWVRHFNKLCKATCRKILVHISFKNTAEEPFE